jgi:hypothetical protein
MQDGRKYTFVGPGVGWPHPERKRRNRLKICPKQSAFSLIEQQRGRAIVHAIPIITISKAARQQLPAPTAKVEDLWDRMIGDEEAYGPFSFSFFS